MGYITCPKCGERIKVNNCGRKKKEVSAEIIFGAIRSSVMPDGTINYSQAGRLLAERSGVDVCRDFARTRLIQMAEKRGITREELLAEILRNEN